MKNVFRSLLVPVVATLAFGAVACSQGPGDDAAAASSEALGITACALQTNAHAPATGTSLYTAYASQYAHSACAAYTVDVMKSSSVKASIQLLDGAAITAAQCASLYADVKLVEYEVDVIDCSELPKPCKSHIDATSTIVGEGRVGGKMVSTPTGLQCQLPSVVLVNKAVPSDYDTTSVKLHANVYQGSGVYDDLVLTVTTQ